LVIKLQTALDSGKLATGLFVDFTKAFDTINHNLLLNKLEVAGIRGNALLWFKSYLKNRTHYVEIGNKKSEGIKIDKGVPQGSILGPLLFFGIY